MKNILKKCIEELAKPEPKLDYVRGMLEVLVEQDQPVMPASFVPVRKDPPAVGGGGINLGQSVLENGRA